MASGNLRLALAAPAESGPDAGLSLQPGYEAPFRSVWGGPRSLGVSEPNLDDAVHDVFLVVQRKLAAFDGRHAALTTWLYAIALRVGRRYRTRNAREHARQVSLTTSAADDGPAALASGRVCAEPRWSSAPA